MPQGGESGRKLSRIPVEAGGRWRGDSCFTCLCQGGESTDRKQDKAVAIRHRDTPFVTSRWLFVTYPGRLSRIFFCPCPSFMFVAGKHNEHEDMKWKIIFLMTGGLLFVQASVAQKSVTDTVRLTFNIDSIGLDEVVVRGKKTPAANSRWSDMHPVELVTVGGANGDLYKALQTLPGTQVQGETGELLVRGGSSYETQTFIDGMHVLNPYTSNGINTPSRSRYSTFMFSGVNFASGGASQEYGEALSAVLPLETKDYSKVDKVGVNASVVGVGGGGTKTWTVAPCPSI